MAISRAVAPSNHFPLRWEAVMGLRFHGESLRYGNAGTAQLPRRSLRAPGEVAPRPNRGFGVFDLITGLTLLGASVITGGLWSTVGVSMRILPAKLTTTAPAK